MRTIMNLVYGTKDEDSQKLDLYLPEQEEFDILVYFHGGGLEAGDKAEGQYLRDKMLEEGYAIASANYRMYPAAHFPEFLEDGAEAVNWVLQHISQYGKAKKIYIGGGSAGAYITAMLAFDPSYLGTYGIRTTDICGYLINSAQTTTHFNVLRERGLDTRRLLVDEAAPVYHIKEDSEYSRYLILVSDRDMPCRYEQNLVLKKTLTMFGCPEEQITFQVLEGFGHCAYMGSDVYTDAVLAFLKEA